MATPFARFIEEDMSVVEWNDVTVSARPATARTATDGTAVDTTRQQSSDHHFWARLGTAALLAAIAGGTAFLDVIADSVAGSPRAYQLALPVLLLLGASGYRSRTRGVGDDETDWIVVLLVGGAALAGIHVVNDRLPTLAGLWRIEMLAVVVWFAGVVALLFGVRHAAGMWLLWLFAAAVATPLPFLLLCAMLGGTDTAAVVLASAVGAGTVALSARSSPPIMCGTATAASFLVALASGLTVLSPAGILVASVVAAGVIPALAVVVLNTTALPNRSHWPSGARPTMPHRSARSLAMLCAAAIASMVLPPHSNPTPDAQNAAPDWTGRSALRPVATYPFITRYLGADSRLDRYTVPAADGAAPAAAVDVITTDNAAALDDLADMVWYPTAVPLNYRAATAPGLPAGVRTLHTDAESATTGHDPQWYAVAWNWAVGSVHQQVTVIVNQSSAQMPPEPTAPTLADVTVRPMLWLARQRPESAGEATEIVLNRLSDITAGIRSAAQPTSDGPAGDE